MMFFGRPFGECVGANAHGNEGEQKESEKGVEKESARKRRQSGNGERDREAGGQAATVGESEGDKTRDREG